MEKEYYKLVAQNKKASHEYFFEKLFEKVVKKRKKEAVKKDEDN